VISLVHSIASVRNHIYSSSRVLDAVNSYPAKNLKELAKHPEFIVFAVRLKNIEAVTCMLKHGADPNKLDSQERTPLHVAVELGHDEIVALLFSYRADPEIMFAGLPLALLAVSNGHANVLQLLIKKFPKMRDTKSPAPKLRSLLHVAAKSGRAQAVAVLLVLGMDPNLLSGDSFTPLHVASSPEICKLLVDAGASIRNLTPDGKDVLNQALFPVGPGSFVNLDVVTFVLENDTENFFQDPRDGANSLHQVKALDVRNQYRDNLPLWIGKLPNLESIQAVEGNNLRSIPKNALEAGDEGVLNYLKDIGAGSKGMSLSRKKRIVLFSLVRKMFGVGSKFLFLERRELGRLTFSILRLVESTIAMFQRTELISTDLSLGKKKFL
jgi:ankyrin repeat protein